MRVLKVVFVQDIISVRAVSIFEWFRTSESGVGPVVSAVDMQCCDMQQVWRRDGN